MKRYEMTFGQSLTHMPEHPERTARKAIGIAGEIIIFQVWPSRAAMLKTLEMQDRRARKSTDWRPCA